MQKIQKYVDKIKRHAYPVYDAKTCGKCALACRLAIEHGLGVELNRVMSAKDYGPSLVQAGFCQVFDGSDTSGFALQLGDVAIIHYNPHGHICIFDGKEWYSDFKQRDIHGGKIRDSKPKITIFRLNI